MSAMSASASARLYWGGVAAKLGLLAVAVHVLNSMSPARDRVLGPDAASALARLEAATASVRLLPAVVAVLAAAAALRAWLRSSSRVYLLDFACYRGPDEIQTPLNLFLAQSRASGAFSDEALEFQTRISQRNGVSDHAYLPPALVSPAADRAARYPGSTLTSRTMEEARVEARMVLFRAVDDVLTKLALSPTDVDVLIVNCSLFNPTPSLSAMVVNHFKMRSDIVSFNLAGMGCSAGVLAVQLAQKVLATMPGARALVVSTENVTQNWYLGEERSMLIPNTLFRMGGAAVVLTNRAAERPRAKYELGHVVRVHLGADDVAYECVYQREDAKGIIGVELNRDLVKVAGKALQKNMTKMAPLVLPLSEQLKFAAVWAVRAALPPNHPRRPAPYVPDFKKAFDHFCLHAGGRGVIEGLSKQLALPAGKQAPSYNSLFWYGNTSSASLWYALGYIETVQGVKSGDVVWQVGFGSGFKCNSAVWTALRPIKETAGHAAWAHMAHPSNVGAVDAYLKNGGTSQGPGAPACAGTRGGGEGRVTSPRAARAAKRA